MATPLNRMGPTGGDFTWLCGTIYKANQMRLSQATGLPTIMHMSFETDSVEPPADGSWSTKAFWVGGSFVAASLVTLLTTLVPIAQMGYAATHPSVQGYVLDLVHVPNEPWHPAHTETVVAYSLGPASPLCRSVFESPRRGSPILHRGQIITLVPRNTGCGAPLPILVPYVAPIAASLTASLALVALGAFFLAVWWWMGHPQPRPPRRDQIGGGTGLG